MKSKLRPFRFGIVSSYAKTREEWITKAIRAEELGYSVFLVPDHFSVDVAPVSALMAAATATTSIRIGSHVFGNDFRNPVMLAKEVATLDMLSGGRCQFGLGTGYLPDDYQQASIALDEPKVRVDRFSEALHIIKRYFTDEVVNFAGKYYNVTNLKGNLTHVQKPYPPIYTGGSGKRMLTIAGREADIVGIGPGYTSTGMNMANSTAEPTFQKLAWVREAAAERFDQLELATMVFVMLITDHQTQAAQQIASKFAVTPEQVLDSLQMLIGTVDQIVETLQTRRERYGISYVQVTEEHLEMLAPIVARLAGK